MPTPQGRLDLDRVLNSIAADAAIVILVNGGDIETATKGIDNDFAIFDICFSVAAQLAEGIFADMPAEQQRQAALYLPSQEDARRLGIWHARRNGQ